MTYEEMVEFVEQAIDELKSNMEDEIDTLQKEVDDLKTDLESVIQEIDL